MLWRAWVDVRRNDGAAGIDQTTLAMVEEYGVDRLLDEIATELREAGIGRGPLGGCSSRSRAAPKGGRAVDPDGPGPGCAGGDQDRARADLRGRHGGLLVRVPPETVRARRLAGTHRRVLAGQTVGGGDRYRELFGCFITLLLRLIVVIKQAVLGFWWLDAQTLSASGAEVHGLEFAALDTLQQGLAGYAVGQGCFEGGQPALGGVIDEQRADVVGEPDPPGCAGGELFAGDESSPSQRCRVEGARPSWLAASATVSSSPCCGSSLGWWQGMAHECRRLWTLLAVKDSFRAVRRPCRLRIPAILASG